VNPFKKSPTDYPNHVEPPDPIGGRRLTGVHWWDPDRIHHLEDLPRHCPQCGAGLGDGISVEYWEADQRVYHTWCHGCGWTGDIVRVRRMIGHEAED
jgi:hypothetical protein